MSNKIPTDWRETTLGEITTYINRGVAPKYSETDGNVVLNQRCIRNWEISLTDSRLIRRDQMIPPGKYIKKFDILICSTGVGTLGRVSQVKNADERITVDSHVTIVRPDLARTSPIFLGYLLKKSEREIEQMAEGSTGQTELARAKLTQFKIKVPATVESQNDIAEVVLSLDDKIELLRQENKTLESIAQALFKHWFIDFEFPNEKGKPYKSSGGKMIDSDTGQLPGRWSVTSLDQIADFLNGVASQKYPPKNDIDYLPVIKIKEMNSGVTKETDRASNDIDPKYIVKSSDLLFSWSGSLDICLWSGIDGVLNQHLFKVTSDRYPKWFYYHWLLRHLQEFRSIAAGKSTTMGHIQRHHLSEAKVLVPDDAFLAISDRIISPFFEKQIKINQQVQILSKLRDTLLPKLMKGEIRVES